MTAPPHRRGPVHAAARTTAADDAEVVQLAAVQLAGATYAIDILRVHAIVTPLPVTPLPRAPAFVEGVVVLRGVVLAVVDLRKRLGLPAPPPDPRHARFVLVTLGEPASELRAPATGRSVALIVDGASEVIRARPDELRAAPPLAPVAAASSPAHSTAAPAFAAAPPRPPPPPPTAAPAHPSTASPPDARPLFPSVLSRRGALVPVLDLDALLGPVERAHLAAVAAT